MQQCAPGEWRQLETGQCILASLGHYAPAGASMESSAQANACVLECDPLLECVATALVDAITHLILSPSHACVRALQLANQARMLTS